MNTKRPGGLTLKKKQPPAACPYPNCSKSNFKNYHAYLGHLAVHKYAQNRGLSYLEGARLWVWENLVRHDPAPWNGAWTHQRYLDLKKQAEDYLKNG